MSEVPLNSASLVDQRSQRPRRTTRRILELRAVLNWYSSQFKNNHFTEMCCGTEAGSYLRLIDSCVTQLKAPGPSRTCNECKEEDQRSQRPRPPARPPLSECSVPESLSPKPQALHPKPLNPESNTSKIRTPEPLHPQLINPNPRPRTPTTKRYTLGVSATTSAAPCRTSVTLLRLPTPPVTGSAGPCTANPGIYADWVPLATRGLGALPHAGAGAATGAVPRGGGRLFGQHPLFLFAWMGGGGPERERGERACKRVGPCIS